MPLPMAATSIELARRTDRKSTRLNSSHGYISYAVFCLKKKKKKADSEIDVKRASYTEGNIRKCHLYRTRNLNRATPGSHSSVLLYHPRWCVDPCAFTEP